MKDKKLREKRISNIILALVALSLIFIGGSIIYKGSGDKIAGKGANLTHAQKQLNKDFYKEEGIKVYELVEEVNETSSEVRSFDFKANERVSNVELTDSLSIINDHDKTVTGSFEEKDGEYIKFASEGVYKDLNSPENDAGNKIYDILEPDNHLILSFDKGLDVWVKTEEVVEEMPKRGFTHMQQVISILDQYKEGTYIGKNTNDKEFELVVPLQGTNLIEVMDLYGMDLTMVTRLDTAVDKIISGMHGEYKVIVDRETKLIKSMVFDLDETVKDMAESINSLIQEERFEFEKETYTIEFSGYDKEKNIDAPDLGEEKVLTNNEYLELLGLSDGSED